MQQSKATKFWNNPALAEMWRRQQAVFRRTENKSEFPPSEDESIENRNKKLKQPTNPECPTLDS